MAAKNISLRAAIFSFLPLAAVCALAGLKDKEPAPHFNAITTTGEKFTNETIKGKVVLLEFWTTWCGFCADEAAFVDKIAHELAGKYQANAYPSYVVIDRDGFIVGTQRGAGGEDALRRLIARAGIESPDADDSDAN